MTSEASPAVQSAPAPVFRRVYVWELPVRLYHWLNALCVLVLTVTGILIAHPPAFASATEASFSYWFGINRFIHFATAYVFFFNFAFRIYWGFVGNQFADWRNFLPLRAHSFGRCGAVLRVDVLQATNKPIEAVGHNALAYFTYFVMFLVFLFQVVSGFAMYASMSKAWFPQLFTWAVPLFGGEYALRQWHYMAMWFFIDVHDRPRLPRVLPRLRRGARRDVVDGRRLEVRASRDAERQRPVLVPSLAPTAEGPGEGTK